MSILPNNMQRYQKFISFMLKYWNSGLFEQATTKAFEDRTTEDDNRNFNQSPKELVEDLKKMGPTYVKLGQLLSTRPDLLPDAYLHALTDLQDKVSAISFSDVKRTIENELHTGLDKAFKSFDKDPLACASIGQVHKAVLFSGEEVAVKIQRPGIKQKFAEDIQTLEKVIALAIKHTEVARKYAFGDILDELRQVLLQELNYELEARNLIALHHNLAEYEELIVPLPFTNYSSLRVLTMQFIEGKKITDVPVAAMKSDPEDLARKLVNAYLQQILKDGFVHADPHPGNVHYTTNHKIALIDLGMVARFSKNMQEYLIQLLLALTNKNAQGTAEILLTISETQQESDILNFKKKIIYLVVNQQLNTSGEMETGRLLIQLNRIAAEHYVKLPVDINILGKVLLNLEQIITTLHPSFDVRKAIKENLFKIIRNSIKEETKLENLISLFIEGKRLAKDMPRRLNEISRHFANNNFKVKIEAVDEKRITDGFQKVANRIALGLIIAAMILGAAILMRVPSDFVIFGYPGLAMIFFLLAALGGIILSLVIIFKDEN